MVQDVAKRLTNWAFKLFENTTNGVVVLMGAETKFELENSFCYVTKLIKKHSSTQCKAIHEPK